MGPQSLRKGGREGANNFLGALLAVPRNTHMMFVHAVQVLLDNARLRCPAVRVSEEYECTMCRHGVGIMHVPCTYCTNEVCHTCESTLVICSHAHGAGVSAGWVLTVVCELAVFSVECLFVAGKPCFLRRPI